MTFRTSMNNPWLDIPEADYVAHMSSAVVGQECVLSRLLGEILDSLRPSVVLILGCSSGNGLEHVNPALTSRVVGVDINHEYLHRLRERFPNPPFELDARCGDVMKIELEREAFDLVHGALIFEYVEWRVLLPRLASALKPGGVLSVILQSPSVSSPAVTATPFTSLQKLETLFRFVDPAAFVDAARDERLELNDKRAEPLPAGKAFDVLRFTKDPACGGAR